MPFRKLERVWRLELSAGLLAGVSEQLVDAPAGGQAGGAEGGFQLVAAFGEVGPAVVVDRDDTAGVKNPSGLGRLRTVQHERVAVEEHGETGRAGEQDGGVHRGEAIGDLPDRVEGGVVAADVDRRQALAVQDEADDLAGERLDFLAWAGAVDGGNTGDGDGAAAGALQLDRLPVGQALGLLPEAFAAAGSGQREGDVGEQGTAGCVEVVRVLVVREQDHVDGADVGGRGGGRLGLDQGRSGRGVVAGAVEGRVGQEAQATVLEQGGRAAERADRELIGVELGHHISFLTKKLCV
jgi:hypothetical protein